MLSVLLKKQLKEFKFSYFTNKKTGKPRSKTEIALYSVLYFFLYCLLVFSIFAITMGIRIYVDTKETVWIMFAIMSFVSIFVSTFINMLITRGILFEAKDNELMLSLPIPDKYIIISRMLNVFLNSLIYTSMLWIPSLIHYFIFYGFDILVLVYGILLFILITLIVVSLSCLFGYGLSLLMNKFPKKNLLQTIITLLFLIVYYVVYFKANSIMTALLANLPKFESAMKTKGILLYAIAKAACGDSLYLLVALGFTIVICVVCFALILTRYRKLLVSSPKTNKKEFKGYVAKTKPVKQALINIELKRFFSNATYTLNCGLGIVILAAGAIALIIFSGKIQAFLEAFSFVPQIKEWVPVILLGAISTILSLDALSVPAVSLEGKNYWLIRSLPVSTYDVLDSKRELQFRLHVIPLTALSVICTYVFNMEGLVQVGFVICSITSLLFITYCDLFLGIKGANLKWNDEIFVIKQSGNVFVAIFGGMIIYVGIPVLFIFVLSKYISIQIFLIIMIIIFVGVSLLINYWVKTKGVKLFENLG